jgi:ABC-type lipopolysaccharide export system ATPase subunit
MYEDASGNMQQFTLYDNISEFIQTYEENRKNKKKIKDDKLLEDLDVKVLDELGKDLLGPDEA